MSTHGDDRRPCAGLWNTPMVYVDGSVTTCCLDQHMDNALGDLTRESFGSIWNGPTNHGWRVAQIEDRYEDSGPYCSRCNWRSAGAMPHDKVVDYLSRTGEEQALATYRRRWKLPVLSG
jgi:radical SAM protein with 4Fe4S-binding SPASM domain